MPGTSSPIELESVELLNLLSLVQWRIKELRQLAEQSPYRYLAEEQLLVYEPLAEKLKREVSNRGL